MRLLVDVDALAKLAHWKLLEELASLTGVPLTQCATLTSARYRAKRAIAKPDKKLFRTTEAAQIALAAADCMTGQIDPRNELIPVLQDIPGIDAGEAVLLSATAGSPDAQLLTGDKRALRALSQLNSEHLAKLAGKIIVIEQLLLATLNQHGINRLRELVCPHKDIDKAIGIVMGSRCDASESAVREGLNSYIREIASSCSPSLLAPIP